MMNAALPAPEVGETVATYKKYEGAQRAVSKLIEHEVPARDIAIVGRSLRSVEKITGKLGWARAARQGALNGIMLGLLFAAFAIIWLPEVQTAVVGGILLIGVGFGMALRLLNYSVVRRRRDFASVMTITADHYEVAVSHAHVATSRRVLGTERTRTVVSQPPSDEPPKYGIRIDNRPRPERPAEETPADDRPAEGRPSEDPDQSRD